MPMILDMDGTIIDAVPSILRSINQTLEAMGYDPVEPGDIKFSGLPLRNILSLRLKKDELEKGIKLYRDIQYSTFMEDTRVFPGAQEMLEKWRRDGHKTGIFTLRSGATARLVLENFRMMPLFDAVVGYDETACPKPDARHVEDTACLMGVEPSDSLVIGDNPVDILSGIRAGAKTVGVLWGLASRRDIEEAGAWRIASDWDELGRIVDEWENRSEER